MDNRKKRILVSNATQFQRVADGSRSMHCFVPLCAASNRYNMALTFHRFPRDAKLCAQWINNIKRQCAGKPTGRVCSRHFESEQIFTIANGKRVLVPNAVPTLFHWNNYTKPCPQSNNSEAVEHVPPMDHDYAVCSKLKYENMFRVMEELQCPISLFGSERFAGSPENVRFYTRFSSYKHLMEFWNLIKKSTTSMVWVTASTCTSTQTTSTTLLPIDELFLFLKYMATGCTQRELSDTFNIPIETVSRIIVTWANFLYTLLGSISIWMSPAAVKANLPSDFNGKYKNTQVILDWIKVKCQTHSSLLSPKSHCTFKALVGMSPHGALTFVSALFEGSLSDTELFQRSGITSLLTPDMDIMVDKGFLVKELVSGNIHRLSEVDVVPSQPIARLKVHVDNVTRRVKEYKLFDTVIPLSISRSMNQLSNVACLLTNYQYGSLVRE